jgi:hypothetical protein
MKKYLNIKSVYGVETIDEIDSNDFSIFQDFRKEKNRLIKEYRLAGMQVYQSQRCDKTWKDK